MEENNQIIDKKDLNFKDSEYATGKRKTSIAKVFFINNLIIFFH